MIKHEIKKIEFDILGFANYRGFVVEKLVGGFRIMGQSVTTLKEVDKVIEQAYSSLEKSIDR